MKKTTNKLNRQYGFRARIQAVVKGAQLKKFSTLCKHFKIGESEAIRAALDAWEEKHCSVFKTIQEENYQKSIH